MSMIFTHVCGAPQAVLLHQDSWALGPDDSRPWTIPRGAGGPAVPLQVVPLPKGPEPETCPHAAKSTCGVTPTCLGALRPWPAWPNTAAQSGGPDRNSPGVHQCRALPVTRSVLLVQIFSLWNGTQLSFQFAFPWLLVRICIFSGDHWNSGVSFLHNLPSEKGTENCLRSVISAKL